MRERGIKGGSDSDEKAQLTAEIDVNLKESDRSGQFPHYIVEGWLGLSDPPYDEDGTFQGMCASPAQAQYIWRLAWFSLISGIYGLARGHYDLACVPLGVWLTSIGYWWKPDFSWRRYFDMGFVHVSLGYQLLRAIYAENAIPYFIVLFLGVAAFPLACIYKARSPWFSIIAHGMVHIFGNISNFILYSGNIPPASSLKQLFA